MENFASIDAFVNQLKEEKKKISLLVLNAGVMSKSSFATNVLGNARLLHQMIQASTLTENERIIFVTGEIYYLESDCTADFDGFSMRAYLRSKLGLNWLFNEFHDQYPSYEVWLLHSSITASELTGQSPVGGGLKRPFSQYLQKKVRSLSFCVPRCIQKISTMEAISSTPEDCAYLIKGILIRI